MTAPGKGLWLGAAALLALFARDAHAAAPAGRYTIASGTVVDTKTGLTWQQAASSMTYTWSNAKAYCTSLGAGWRMPTISELVSIVDYTTTASPRIDGGVFMGTQANFYWASTLLAGSPSVAWNVNFTNGSPNYFDVTNAYPVRCVR